MHGEPSSNLHCRRVVRKAQDRGYRRPLKTHLPSAKHHASHNRTREWLLVIDTIANYVCSSPPAIDKSSSANLIGSFHISSLLRDLFQSKPKDSDGVL